ncbi:alpha/beta hydrolase [Yinghuangia seranimata]|uniref:alpha/beta hydrolase n=1 Tax=Yinghuangia seranimata TaxID=408067 RepID=UPI00248B969F|nr:alpha/beta hydrolase-fold protein [Yinghuangia seranimata]MDI2127265.1 alpha/beta hydrolase-fold protein [Yinghuangia seranimata]MDI2132210.1 alpha/beta hydrolase-fold protein [Yinghuangia seranimata]
MGYGLAARPAWDMDITSWWFVLGMALATVGAAVATVLTWHRRRLKRTRRVTALIVTQLMVTLTILAAVNSQMYFYSTVSDVLSIADGPPGPKLHVPHVDGPDRLRADAATPGPGVPGWLSAHKRLDTRHGVLVSTTVTGARSRHSLPAHVYLPAAYFDPARADERFPVIQLQSGYPGTPSTWVRRMRIERILAGLMGSGRVPPVIAVLPEQNPVQGRDSECVDAVDGARAATYLGEDVPDAVAANFRTAERPARWGIMGYSTGGFCAANLAIRYPDRFGAAASLSGYYKAITDMTTGDLYKGDEQARKDNSPIVTIDRPRERPLRMYLFAARGEGHAVRDMQKFALKFRAPNEVTTVVAQSGGHNFHTWSAGIPAALEWLGARVGEPPRDVVQARTSPSR